MAEIAQIISSAVQAAVETACASIVSRINELTEENKQVNEGVLDKIEELTDKVNSVHLQSASVVAYEPISVVLPTVKCEISLDVVKSIPDFSGESAKYISWRQAVKTAMKLFQPYEGSERHYQAVAIIRNKIVGSADLILSSFNTVLNIDAIIARLDNSYSDKRPLHVLENQLSILCQGTLSISEYFDRVEKHLTSITNKISMDYSGNNQLINSLATKYRGDALRVFISGLNKPICNILFSAGCEDLPSALAKAQELEANQYRYNFARAFDNSLYADPRSVNVPLRNNPNYRRVTQAHPPNTYQKNQNYQPAAPSDHMSVDNSSRVRHSQKSQIQQAAPAGSSNQTIRQQPQNYEFSRTFKRPRDSDKVPLAKTQRINFIKSKNDNKEPKSSPGPDCDTEYEFEDEYQTFNGEYYDQLHFLE